MVGVITNCVAVILGSVLGLLFKKGIPERISDSLMKCVGLITTYIAITGLFGDNVNALVVILALVIGTLIGEIIDIDKWLSKLGGLVESKFKKDDGKTSVAEGFVNASLLFCVGAMTVVGSLQAGLTGDNGTLYTKSILDFISATIFASTLGYGVIFSTFTVLVIQGGIALCAGWLAPLLTDTVVTNMTVVGSLLIFALSLNLLKIAKIKTANMLPAIFLPLAFCPLYDLIVSWF